MIIWKVQWLLSGGVPVNIQEKFIRKAGIKCVYPKTMVDWDSET